MASLTPTFRTCQCDIVANFPIVAGLGVISASLRSNANVVKVGDSLIAHGPTYGDLSLTAYDPLIAETLPCAANASVSFEWEQHVDCDTEVGKIIMRFIPRGREKAFQEGQVTNKISMAYINKDPYTSFNASASSGPHTPYFMNSHYDGYDFRYTGKAGNPVLIPIDANSGAHPTVVTFLNTPGHTLLPGGSALYLTNFSWTYNPPEVPTVSYSFLFSYSGG
jgi:hypothetical protein